MIKKPLTISESQMLCLTICDTENCTFANRKLLWYNERIKGDFTMNKTMFEQMGGIYTMQGDYCLPNLTLPTEEERP